MFEHAVMIPKAKPRFLRFTIFEGIEKMDAGTNAANIPVSKSKGIIWDDMETKKIKDAKITHPCQ